MNLIIISLFISFINCHTRNPLRIPQRESRKIETSTSASTSTSSSTTSGLPIPSATTAGYAEWRIAPTACNCEVNAYGVEFSFTRSQFSNGESFLNLKLHIISSFGTHEPGFNSTSRNNYLDSVFYHLNIYFIKIIYPL